MGGRRIRCIGCRGDVTVVDVAVSGTAEEHRRKVKEWAECVWSAWAEHHDTIREWIPKS